MSKKKKKVNKEKINKDSFKELEFSSRIFLDFDLKTHFNYSYRQTRFKFSDALRAFLNNNERINIYFTNNPEVTDFVQYGNDWLVNIDDYIRFCDEIGYYRSDPRRVEAYFGQHISIANLSVSEDEKIEFLKTSVSDKDLLIGIKNLPEESRKSLIDAIFEIDSSEQNDESESIISDSEFIEIFTKFITSKKVQNSFFEKIPEVQIKALEDLKVFVENNLDQNETFFQNWIDEENGKYRSTRCMIFGIEYVDPKREGEIMGRKRFDILATQNLENHILIELKSPTAEIFDIEERENKNCGKSTSYSLSKDLSRAIPQILGYKKWYQSMSSEKVEELGISEKKSVSDCIIVIGQRKECEVWKENFKDLKNNIGIKIWTYNDLIDRMTNTIRNLKENL
ncbi:MAG: Shedu anti-phage system protein SduA domain-containing protein [Flavobacteriaceae bacterium]